MRAFVWLAARPLMRGGPGWCATGGCSGYTGRSRCSCPLFIWARGPPGAPTPSPTTVAFVVAAATSVAAGAFAAIRAAPVVPPRERPASRLRGWREVPRHGRRVMAPTRQSLGELCWWPCGLMGQTQPRDRHNKERRGGGGTNLARCRDVRRCRGNLGLAARDFRGPDHLGAVAEGARRSAGPPWRTQERSPATSKHVTSLPGRPDAMYVVIRLQSRSSTRPAGCRSRGPGQAPDESWQVAGYFIRRARR